MEAERLGCHSSGAEMSEPVEVWRPAFGFEGHYSVSSEGRVRRDRAGKGARAGYVLKATIMKANGYMRVGLVVAGRQVTRTIHSLVAEAFLGPYPAGEQWSVNHIDGNKLNNSASNLEYLTLAENAKHAHQIGLYLPLLTHCYRGHPFDSTNTIRHANGERDCRACNRLRQRKYKEKVKQRSS